MATFGERFRLLRQERKLGQDALTRDFNEKYHYNLTKSSISQYENDRRIPEIDALVHFAEYFSVSVDFLLGISDIRKPLKKNQITYGNLSDFTYAFFKDQEIDSIEKAKFCKFVTNLFWEINDI